MPKPDIATIQCPTCGGVIDEFALVMDEGICSECGNKKTFSDWERQQKQPKTKSTVLIRGKKVTFL